MDNQLWSYIVTAVGITGFFFVGRKVWWAWYINLACQALWFIYAIVTDQPGFIIAALFYTIVFGKNAYQWTKERFSTTEKQTDSTDNTPIRYTVKLKVHPSHYMGNDMSYPRCRTCGTSKFDAWRLRFRCSKPTYEIVYTK